MSTLDDWELTSSDATGEYSVWRRFYEYPVERIRQMHFIRYERGEYYYTSYDHNFQWQHLPHVSSIEEAQQVVDVLLRLGE